MTREELVLPSTTTSLCSSQAQDGGRRGEERRGDGCWGEVVAASSPNFCHNLGGFVPITFGS